MYACVYVCVLPVGCQVEGLLTRQATTLIGKGRTLEAVELYRLANRPTEAAILLGEIAEKAATQDVKPNLAKVAHDDITRL